MTLYTESVADQTDHFAALLFLKALHMTMTLCTGGKPRNYHEIVLMQFCSQATSRTRHGSFQAEN